MADQISAFAEKIRSDSDLRAKLVALQGSDASDLPDKIASLAKDNGFLISAHEVKDFILARSKPVELTDAALTSNQPHALNATYSWPGC